MPLNRTELTWLSAGIAVGALAGAHLSLGIAVGVVAGANMDKVKNLFTVLFGLVSDGVGDAYSAAAQKVAEQVEKMQDAAAANASNNGTGK